MLVRRTLASLTALVALSPFFACTDDFPEDDGGMYLDDGPSGSGPMTGSGTTGGSDPTSDGPGTTGPGTDGTTAGSGSSDGTGSTGAIEEACEAFCDNWARCLPAEPPPPDCVQACVDEPEADEAVCIEATADYYRCVGALECTEFIENVACIEQDMIAAAACGSSECFVGVGGDELMCSISLACPGVGVEQEMSCDTETCTCLDGGMEVGSCEAMSVCEAMETLHDHAIACCGFEIG